MAIIKVDYGEVGGGGTWKAFKDSASYSGSVQKTFSTGIPNLKDITVTIIASAGVQYVGTFVYKIYNGSSFVTQAFYTNNSGGGINNGGTKYALTTGSLPQCPNITKIENGDITVLSPNAQTWNIGTMYISAIGE